MRIIIIALITLFCVVESTIAQPHSVGISYSFAAEKSQNNVNTNIASYSKNNRIELRYLTKKWYSHLGMESIGFYENAVLSSNNPPHELLIGNPALYYDLKFINLGLGWHTKPFRWIRLTSGFTAGFVLLSNSEISINDKMEINGHIVYLLNNLYDKKEAVKGVRINVFQAIEAEYIILNNIKLSVGYKFEVPLLPLVVNDSAVLPYYRLSNEDKEHYLQFITLGIGYNF